MAINTTKFNYAEELKVEVGDLSSAQASNGSAPSTPLPVGRFPAFLQGIQQETYKSGSSGITATYVLDGGIAKNRKIKERLVLTRADGSTVEYAGQRLKRRLLSWGMPLEKIQAFKGPRNEHDMGDFKLVLGAPVTVTIKDEGEYQGRPSRGVGAVFSREVSENA